MATDPSAPAPAAPVTTYFNGACPVCGTAIARYRRIAAGDSDLAWCDIDRDPDALAERGIAAGDVRRKLHVIDREGRLLVGVPAFAALWDELPHRRWLARLVRLPVVAIVAAGIYEALATLLFAWNRRRAR